MSIVGPHGPSHSGLQTADKVSVPGEGRPGRGAPVGCTCEGGSERKTRGVGTWPGAISWEQGETLCCQRFLTVTETPPGSCPRWLFQAGGPGELCSGNERRPGLPSAAQGLCFFLRCSLPSKSQHSPRQTAWSSHGTAGHAVSVCRASLAFPDRSRLEGTLPSALCAGACVPTPTALG